MFTCTCSFKREEYATLDYQGRFDIKEKYRDVIEGKEDEPMEHPVAPSQDSAYFHEVYLPSHPEHFNPIGGIHVHRADMRKYNESREPIHRRQLTFYTLRGSLPLPTAPYPPPSQGPFALTRAANLHACAHLFASDCNTLYIVPNHLGRPRDYTRIASLAHTVIFHVGIKDLVMAPEPRISHPNAVPTLFEPGSLPLCNVQGDTKGDRDGRKWFVQES